MLRLTGTGAQPAQLHLHLPQGIEQDRDLGLVALESPSEVQVSLPADLVAPIIRAADAGELGACELRHLDSESWFSLQLDQEAQASRSDLPAGLYQLYLLGQPQGQLLELQAGQTVELIL